MTAATPGSGGPFAAWLFHELPAAARSWLPAQRWFGGKSRAIARVEVEDFLLLAEEPVLCALVVIDVEYEPAVPHQPRGNDRYAMVVGVSGDTPVGSAIGCVEWQPGLRVAEAAADGPAARAVLRGFVSGEPMRGVRGGLVTYADSTQAVRQLLAASSDATPDVVAIGAEQSNTSLRLGRSHVFKLFRRLDDGESPQLEMGRFLATRTSFRSAPPLEGSLTYRSPGGSTATLGLVEGWVDNRGDGWNHVVTQIGRGTRDGQCAEGLARDMFVLGTTTADLHLALASDDGEASFAPEPVTRADVMAWRAALFDRAERAMALIERHHTQWPDEAQRLGGRLLGSRVDLAQRFPVQDLWPGGRFHKIRVHGDYHLGQTLKTAEGFALIDFEGEPAASLADRRQKRCALKDVAGMIRSFEYASETAHARTGAVAGVLASASGLREAFVNGYAARATAAGAAFLPSATGCLDGWMAFFELEKALYEVEYELNNRPAWVHIPLRGVLRILEGQAT